MKKATIIPALNEISVPKEQKGVISLFKDWLTDNYMIKVNSLDTEDIYITATEDNPIQYNYEITESDIYLHAINDGIKINRSIIQNILASPNQCKHFNPITEYLENLRNKYTGPSQIDYLLNCLLFSKSQDIEKCRYIVRKWLYATAACALGLGPNDVALGIISERAGIGKTTFLHEILPLELSSYKADILKRNTPVLPSELFANKLILNFDEFSAITASNEDQFKQLISASEVSCPVPGTRRRSMKLRIASACFTSNKTKENGGFIRTGDNGMLRRLACIEVDSIEDYRESLNREQLWAEIILHIDGGADYRWNQDDFKYFTETNREYIICSNSMKLLSLYTKKPAYHEKSEYLTSTDIMNRLNKLKLIPKTMANVDTFTIGQALNSLGYERVMKRISGIGPRYTYKILFI